MLKFRLGRCVRMDGMARRVRGCLSEGQINAALLHAVKLDHSSLHAWPATALMDFHCPNSRCSRTFEGWKAVTSHLNQRTSSCFSYFSDADRPSIFNLPAAPSNEHPAPDDIPEDITMLSDPTDMLSDHSIPQSSDNLHTTPVPVTVYHPTSGYILNREGKNSLQRMDDDQYAYRRIHNHFYPFENRLEWELGQFLCSSSLKQNEIDDFLKLPWVSYSSRYNT